MSALTSKWRPGWSWVERATIDHQQLAWAVPVSQPRTCPRHGCFEGCVQLPVATGPPVNGGRWDVERRRGIASSVNAPVTLTHRAQMVTERRRQRPFQPNKRDVDITQK